MPAGFVINEDKSDFIPKIKLKWQSVIINTINLIFTIPQECIVQLKCSIQNVLNQILSPLNIFEKIAFFYEPCLRPHSLILFEEHLSLIAFIIY